MYGRAMHGKKKNVSVHLEKKLAKEIGKKALPVRKNDSVLIMRGDKKGEKGKVSGVNYERGTVWEESLIFLPTNMKILALSATIPNIEELTSWLKSIYKRSLKIVKEVNRPVPLHFFYQTQGELLDNIHKVNTISYKKQKRW